MSHDSKKLIAFNYFGGKFTYCDQLYPLFPDHSHFIDVFAGSMAVILNKPFSKIDTANDINSQVVNFFKVLRDHPKELIDLLMLTPVSREEYNNAWVVFQEDSELEKARKFYIRARQSFYGLGVQRKNKGWHAVKMSSRSQFGETVNKWLNSIPKLMQVAERLMHIQLENKCYTDLIPDMDFSNAFFYLDPPYHPDSRASVNDYKYDFTHDDHVSLNRLVSNVKGYIMMSTYDTPAMRELYKGWYWHSFPPKRNNFRNKVVTECVVLNYQPLNKTLTLF